MDQAIHTKINELSRAEIKTIFESRCEFEIMEYERTEDLREILRQEVEAGKMTLPE